MTTISALLGYPDDSLEPKIHPSRMADISAILARLAEVDNLLAIALPDSMATAVGDLRVDYNAHIGQIKAEGNRLLKQLSALVNLPIAYNRYTGNRSGGSQMSVASYW